MTALLEGKVAIVSGVGPGLGSQIALALARVASRIPLGSIPTDADCAGCVVFLASDLARAVTGHSLDVNGGEVMN